MMKESLHLTIFLVFFFSNNFDGFYETVARPEGPEPVEENYELCKIPYLGSDEPKPVPENLLRMGPNSKYFILAGESNVPIKSVAAFCKTLGLQPAEVRHKVDLMSMEIFLKGSAPEDISFSLGTNDEREEGSFVEYDGTPMQFHAFEEGQPDNQVDLHNYRLHNEYRQKFLKKQYLIQNIFYFDPKQNTQNCIEVKFHEELSQLVYNDADCDRGTTPVCMFKPTDRCFLGSPTTLAKVNEGFELVGSSTVRDYYVKLQQYSWSNAEAECEKAGFKLVDFSTGLSNNQIIYDLIKKWITRNYLFPRISFWTGAKLVQTVDSGQGESSGALYKFETSGRQLNDLSAWPSLVWDTEEPSDASGLGLEECISAILYNPYQSTEDNVFTLSTTNCRIPHYPICYQEKSMNTMKETFAGETNGLRGRAVSVRRGDPSEGLFCGLREIKVDLSLPHLSFNELLKLAAVSRHKDLHTNKFRFKWPERKTWLPLLADRLLEIGKAVCPDYYVPPEFLNIMYNVLILYYHAVADKLMLPDRETTLKIGEEAAKLKDCAENLQPIQFDSVGGIPVTFGKFNVTPIMELIDSDGIIGERRIPDMVIDTFWYMYQVTVAACWPNMRESRSFWLEELHNLFTTYYLEEFQERWISPKIDVDYGVFMGDLEPKVAYYSLKACAIATFYRSNISELYFPRPLFIRNKIGNHEEFNIKIQKLPEVEIETQNFDY